MLLLGGVLAATAGGALTLTPDAGKGKELLINEVVRCEEPAVEGQPADCVEEMRELIEVCCSQPGVRGMHLDVRHDNESLGIRTHFCDDLRHLIGE